MKCYNALCKIIHFGQENNQAMLKFGYTQRSFENEKHAE